MLLIDSFQNCSLNVCLVQCLINFKFHDEVSCENARETCIISWIFLICNVNSKQFFLLFPSTLSQKYTKKTSTVFWLSEISPNFSLIGIAV